jgi:actin-like ATPase involved in cell morphogenesis
MLKIFLDNALGRAARRAVCARCCAYTAAYGWENRALEEAARGAGARAAFLMDEPWPPP